MMFSPQASLSGEVGCQPPVITNIESQDDSVKVSTDQKAKDIANDNKMAVQNNSVCKSEAPKVLSTPVSNGDRSIPSVTNQKQLGKLDQNQHQQMQQQELHQSQILEQEKERQLQLEEQQNQQNYHVIQQEHQRLQKYQQMLEQQQEVQRKLQKQRDQQIQEEQQKKKQQQQDFLQKQMAEQQKQEQQKLIQLQEQQLKQQQFLKQQEQQQQQEIYEKQLQEKEKQEQQQLKQQQEQQLHQQQVLLQQEQQIKQNQQEELHQKQIQEQQKKHNLKQQQEQQLQQQQLLLKQEQQKQEMQQQDIHQKQMQEQQKLVQQQLQQQQQQVQQLIQEQKLKKEEQAKQQEQQKLKLRQQQDLKEQQYHQFQIKQQQQQHHHQQKNQQQQLSQLPSKRYEGPGCETVSATESQEVALPRVAETERKPENREVEAAKAMDKIKSVQQSMRTQPKNHSLASAKQSLEGLVHVTQNVVNSQTVPEQVMSVSLPKTKQHSLHEDSPKIATVRRAAEKFERHTALMNSKSVTDLTFSPTIRGRSKSIGDALRTRFVEDQEPEKGGVHMPWAGNSPQVQRRNEKGRGYALQQSKSMDSITAAKMLAKARAENSGNNLRINQNFSKSIEQQIDVYSKTKEEIRKILNLAKVGSVTDRVALFHRLKDQEPEAVDPEEKAEAIRLEIANARAQALAEKSKASDSDTEIEFQEPIESKVKPLKIPMKQKVVEKPQPGSPGNSLRINSSSQDLSKRERRPSIEDLPSVKAKISNYVTAAEEVKSIPKNEEEGVRPKPILKNDKERSGSPRKTTKAPRRLSSHYLAPDQSIQIYAQSATDVSATEDESEMSRHYSVEPRKSRSPEKRMNRKVSLAERPDPGPVLLQVPPQPSAEAKPGIMKSKSFASSSGQYECSINESAGKKMQMLAFFKEGGQPQQQKTVRIKDTKRTRSSSITSVNDEIMGEDELVDIDAEFDRLLNKTFEKESRQLQAADCVPKKAEGAGLDDRQTRRGRGTVSMDMSALGGQRSLRKSASFGVSDSSAMYPGQAPVIRQKNLTDPLGSLPSSQSKRDGGLPRSQHSSSPTQSEYDTCDPWDDY